MSAMSTNVQKNTKCPQMFMNLLKSPQNTQIF
jgi:hypothetical protein